MANVAYRLFKVQVFKNNARKPLTDGVDLGDKKFQQVVMDTLSRLKGRILHTYPKMVLELTSFNPNRVAQPGDPCFLISTIRSLSHEVIEVGIYKGKFGDLDFLVQNNGQLSNIHNDATVRLLMLRIAFPQDLNCCYVAAQVRANTEACSLLFAFISYQLKLDAHRLSGQNIVRASDWYRFIPVPEADAQRFNNAVGNAQVTAFTLVKKDPGATGIIHQEKVIMQYSNPSLQARRRGLQILQTLATAARHASAHPQSIKTIAEVFPQWQKAAKIDWDNGSVTFTENDKQTTVSALAINQLFVYPLGAKATINQLWADANNHLQQIGQADGVIIPPII